MEHGTKLVMSSLSYKNSEYRNIWLSRAKKAADDRLSKQELLYKPTGKRHPGNRRKEGLNLLNETGDTWRVKRGMSNLDG